MEDAGSVMVPSPSGFMVGLVLQCQQHIIESEHALMLILYSLYCMSGRLGRVPAETLLEKKSVGSYLVRLSVKIWGYTISVKSKECIGQITC